MIGRDGWALGVLALVLTAAGQYLIWTPYAWLGLACFAAGLAVIATAVWRAVRRPA